VKDVVKTAQTKRLNIFAITDHFNEFHELPKRMPKSQLKTYLNTLNDAGVIKGVEAEILSDGVSISKQRANICALVLGGLHILHDRVFWYDNQPILSMVNRVRLTLLLRVCHTRTPSQDKVESPPYSSVGDAYTTVELDDPDVDEVLSALKTGKAGYADRISPLSVRFRVGLGYAISKVLGG
jgi:hypothetical protein